MRILTKQEATRTERPEGGPWTWPETIHLALSDTYPILGRTRLMAADGAPLEYALALRIFETLYDYGYVLAQLDKGETAPASVDLAQAARLLEGVSGLAECTSGELHAELEGMLTGAAAEDGAL